MSAGSPASYPVNVVTELVSNGQKRKYRVPVFSEFAIN